MLFWFPFFGAFFIQIPFVQENTFDFEDCKNWAVWQTLCWCFAFGIFLFLLDNHH